MNPFCSLIIHFLIILPLTVFSLSFPFFQPLSAETSSHSNLTPVESPVPEEADLEMAIFESVRARAKNRTFNPKELVIDKNGTPSEKELNEDPDNPPDDTTIKCYDRKLKIALAACDYIARFPEQYSTLTVRTLLRAGYLENLPVCPSPGHPAEYSIRAETLFASKLREKKNNPNVSRDVINVTVNCENHPEKLSRTVNPNLAAKICRSYRTKIRQAALKYARRNGGTRPTVAELVSGGYLKPGFSTCPARGNYTIAIITDATGNPVNAAVTCSVCVK